MEELLDKIKAKNIGIKLVDNNLKLQLPKGFNDKEVIAEIRERKTEIINFISERYELSEDKLEIEQVGEKPYYQTSSAQKRMFFLYEFDKESTAYNIPYKLNLKGKLDQNKLSEAFTALVARHDILRTSFELLDGVIVQRVYKEVSAEIDFLTVKADELGLAADRFVKPFNLSEAPLIRMAILSLNSTEHVLVVDMHHIVSDGLSEDLIIQDFMALYLGNELPELKLQYKDFAEWQQTNKQQHSLKRQQKFWLEQFQELPDALSLATDFNRPNVKSTQGNTLNFEVETQVLAGFKTLVERQGATLFGGFLTLFNVLLSKLSHQEDIVVGTPVAGREHADFESMIGLFVNTVALRNYPKGEVTFLQFLDEVMANTLAALDHQYYQFEDLVDDLKLERETSRHPLFDVLFVFQSLEDTQLSLPGLEISEFEEERAISKFDLTLGIVESLDKVSFSLNYSTALFREETAARFTRYFEQLMVAVVSEPTQRLKDLSVLTPEEKDQLLFDFNDTKVDFPADQTFMDLFGEQVGLDAEKVALIVNDQQVTYLELDQWSNALAHQLLEFDNPSGYVALHFEPSVEMVVSILAVIKSGQVFIPVDIYFPEDRKAFILNDSNTNLVLTDGSFAGRNFEGNRIVVDATTLNAEADPINRVNENRLLYTIFTSGSTGRSKGVNITHENLINYCNWTANMVETPGEHHFLLTSNYAADAGYQQLFTSLLFGGQLHLLSREVYLQPAALSAYIQDHSISVMKVTPSLLNVLVTDPEFNDHTLKSLRNLIIGGEAINTKDIERLHALYPTLKLMNHYGPTETTIGSVARFIENDEIEAFVAQPTIGKPIDNTSCLVLDRYGNLQPVGVAGELCISGAGVGFGYLNNDQLTQEKFVENPYTKGEGMYRTGDLVRWMPDGQIEFLGRIDHQVKIRGNRIELGEIEHELGQHMAITEAAVIARDHEGTKQLVGYYVADSELKVEALRATLSASLPDYMIPSYFVGMDRLPLTSNGKLDRKALPDPDFKSASRYEAPRTEEEQLLCDIWSEVLGVDQVGIRDNFFAIGGDSIKSIQISSRVRTAGYQLTIQDLFANQYIADLAPKMKRTTVVSEQGIITGEASLTPIQHWFFNGQVTSKNHYNLSLLLNYEHGISATEVTQIFEKITEHHDALRMVFKAIEGRYAQDNKGTETPLSLEELDLSKSANPTEELLAKTTALQASLDLENGPLFKLGLYHLKDGSRLFIVVHHLIMDGVSWRILIEDIDDLHKQLKEGSSSLTLPPKTDPFLQWSDHLDQYKTSKPYVTAKTYWEKFSNATSGIIPRDFSEGVNHIASEDQVTFKLDKSLTKQLLTGAHEAFGTQINDLLLTGLILGANQAFGLESLKIDMEGHGRQDVGNGVDISRTIGWFTTIFPALLPYASDNLSTQIREVKEQLRQIPNKGFDYLLHQQEQTEVDGPSQVFFEYFGQFDQDLADRQFVMAGDDVGANVSDDEVRNYDWKVSSMVEGEELSVTITYSKAQYETNTVASFADAYQEGLESVVNYCVDQLETTLSPSDVGYSELTISQLDELQKAYDVVDVYPLSPMQEGMLFHALSDPSSEQYFEQMTYRITGKIDIALVEQGMNLLLDRHEVLRTLFLADQFDRAVQVVLRDRQVDFVFHDVRDELNNEADKEEVIARYKALDKVAKFDLSKDTLMRLTVIQTDDQEYSFIWSHHHILMDGWCMSIIVQEYSYIYACLAGGRSIELPDLRPYSEYIDWLEKRDEQEDTHYWKNYLLGFEELISLPRKSAIQESKDVALNNIALDLDESTTEKLQAICVAQGVTLNTVLQSLWGVLLSFYNNQEDVLFGAVVSGRPAEVAGIEEMVGLFINTIPVRIQVQATDTFAELMAKVQQTALDTEPYHYTPLAKIQQASELGRTLFDHILIFENYPISEEISGDSSNGNQEKLTVDTVSSFEQSNYDLAIIISPSKKINIEFSFNELLFDEGIIKQVADHFSRLVDQFCDQPTQRLLDTVLLSQAETQQLLVAFNPDDTATYDEESLVPYINQQTLATPDHTALVFGETQVNYKELDERSNQLANVLLKNNLGTGSIIGLLFDRSPEMIISMLAVLKAGATYLPITPLYPEERINFILEDAKADCLLLQETYTDRDYELPALTYCEEKITSYNATNLDRSVTYSGDDIAYIIYTSGTTGKPKGTPIPHRAVVKLIQQTNFIELTEEDVILQLSNYAFDGSVFDIYGALTNGASLVLIDEVAAKDVNLLGEIIEKQRVSAFFITTSLFNVLVEEQLEKLAGVRKILFGGERASMGHVQKAWEFLSNDILVNAYGPTECTVFATYFTVNESLEGKESIPIGKPVANTQAYIVDANLRPVPVGVTGELCIGGDRLAGAYIGRPELTREKFIDNPFDEGLMYKTGDLARWLPDGNIEYVGRIDHQIKIRGFRVELGEIEQRLLEIENLKDAKVIALDKEGSKYLVAYYAADEPLEVAYLRTHIEQSLPDYMVPSAFIFLEELPLTSNGKLDQRALTAPEFSSVNDYEAASTSEEAMLCEIWSEVLGVDQVGIKDNFFAIGGDSIKSIQISARVRKNGYTVTVQDILAYPTIAQLAPKLKQELREADQNDIVGTAPLTPIQRWYFDSPIRNKSQFNFSLLLNFPDGISLEEVNRIFAKLISHHDALRMVVQQDEGGLRLENKGINAKLWSEEKDLRSAENSSEQLLVFTSALQESLDIFNGPLLKVGLYHMTDGSRLMIAVHHMVFDGVSWRILFEDLNTLYHQVQSGKQTFELPVKTDPFLSWSNHLEQYVANSDQYLKARTHWAQFAGTKGDHISRDFENGSNLLGDEQQVSFSLNKEQTHKFLTDVHKAFNTQANDLLLTGLIQGVNRSYGVENLKLDMEGHGREDIGYGLDLSRTIGWFTTISSVLLPAHINDLGGQIKKVKEALRSTPNKGFDHLLYQYFDQDAPDQPENPQVFFEYLGQFDTDVAETVFSVAGDEIGDNIARSESSAYDWRVSCLVSGDQLQVSIAYSKEQYQSAKIEEVARQYEQSLIELIEFCTEKTETELTPSDVTFDAITIEELDELQQDYALEDVYPLSSMQEGMLFHTLAEEDTDQYFEQMVYGIHGTLDIAIVEQSMNVLMAHHEVLRSCFLPDRFDQSVQIVVKDRKVDFAFVDLRQEVGQTSAEELLEQYKAQDKANKFDLEKDVLMRLTVLQLADQDFVFIWSHHHILMDGWCISIVVNDYRNIYSSLVKGETVNLPAAPKYAAYIKWIAEADQQAANQYWEAYLSGYDSVAQVPFKKFNTASKNVGLEHASLRIGEETVSLLQRLCTVNNITMNNAIQAVWSLLLSQYNNTDDVVFGTVVSGRPAELEGVEDMIGLFINTVPVRAKIDGDKCFMDLLSQLQENALQSESYHHSPLYEVQKFSDVKGELFDHLVVFENYPWQEDLEGHGKGSNSISEFSVFGKTNYDLCITITPGKELEILFKYNGEVFEENDINQIKAHFGQVLNQVIRQPEAALKGVDMLTESERNKVLVDFNQSEKKYASDQHVADAFKAVVRKIKGQPALIKGAHRLTYQELDLWSDHLVWELLSRPDLPDYVALHFETSIEMFVAMLAVIKSGAAFIPLDIDHPNQRKESILRDCGTNLLLTNLPSSSELDFAGEIMTIRKDFDQELQVVTPEYTSEQALYTIFTSGSTGKPKGVRISNRNVLNYTNWMTDAIDAKPGDRFLYTSNYAADSGYQQIFTSLLSGGELHLLEKTEYADPDLVASYIDNHEVKVVKMTPGLLNVFVNSETFDQADLTSVTHFLCGGEQINVRDVQHIHNRLPEARVMNHYGPSETTIGAVAKLISKKESQSFAARPTIGQPIYNTSCMILDQHGRMQPVGVAGELCIGGDGVGLGYLNDQGLTNEKFLAHPFREGQKMYKTGDLAKWLPDGQIEFLGRIDHQVKVRGFRIELSEIEQQLLTQEAIIEAVVTARLLNATQLVAYYVAKEAISVTELRAQLAKTLPDYMIPSYFVWMENLPLTSNGKVDIKALPDPEMNSSDEYVAPRTQEEIDLAEIWSKVLGVEKVGIRDDFFAIGGDSIKSIQISSRARRKGYKLTIQDLFKKQTIEELALVMRPDVIKAETGPVTGLGDLTPIQKRFFNGPLMNKNHFNFSLMLSFKAGITAEVVTTLFGELWKHHDTLRIRFKKEEDQIFLENQGIEVPLSLEEIQLTEGEAVSEQLLQHTTRLQETLDLFAGPLFKLGLYHAGESSYLAMVVHHTLMDGVSWRILFEDIDHLYQQIQDGEAQLKLPYKTTSFLQWSSSLTEYQQSERYVKARAYWKKFFHQKGNPIPRDFDAVVNSIDDEARVSFNLDKAQTRQLLTEANVPFRTQINDLLLTGLIMAANKVFSLDQLKLEMEGHGREDIGLDLDISRTVGWFTSIFPVLLKSKGDMALQVKTIKEALRQMPNKGFDYLLQHFEQPAEYRAPLGTQVFFEYMGQVDSDVADKTFSLTSEGLGPNTSTQEKRNYDWRITGITSNEQLEIGITYSKAQYKEATLLAFAEAYQQSLLELIDFCTTHETVELTPSDVSLPEITIEALEQLQGEYDLENVYPLAPMQEGMLFHALSDPDSDQYFEQITYNIEGTLDIAAVQASMDQLVQRYDVLKTVFLPNRFERPVQVVLKSSAADFAYEDLRGIDSGDLEQEIERHKAADKAKKFDLTKDVLMRLKVLQLDEAQFVFIWSRHHILMDGWCMKTMVAEYSHIYSSIVNQHPINLPKPIPYVNYIEWLEENSKASAASYWKAYLEGYENVASLPRHFDTETEGQYLQLKSEMTLSAKQSRALNQLSVHYGLTMSTILQTLWGVLLGKYNNTRDVVFGNVVSGRPAEIEGVEKIVGLFINTIPVRIQWNSEDSFAQLLQKTQDLALNSELHHSSPLYEVQQYSDLGANLLDHILVFENYPIGEEIASEQGDKPTTGNTISGVSTFEQTNYDLTLDIFTGSEVGILATYDGQVYRKETIDRALTHLQGIIEQVVADSEVALGEISLVSNEEKHHLLHTLNSNVVDFPAEETFLNLFYKSVVRTPEQVAVTDGKHTLTYQELDKLSNRIARFILAQSLGDSTIIPVALNRGVRLVATMMGIHKAGFAFLALDVNQPKERVSSIIADSEAKLVFTEPDFKELVTNEESDTVTVELIPLEVEPIALYSDHSSSAVNEPINDVAYVIYTSGSTGKPKGVLLHQQGMINHFRGLMDLMDLNESDCMAQTAECSFDVFIMQALLCLVFGGKTVVIQKDDVLNGEKLSVLIKEHDITMLELVPSVIKYLLSDEGFDIRGSQLQWLISNGETLTANLARDWYEVYPEAKIINAYGPAEASDDVTAYVMPQGIETETDTTISIGKPLTNIHISILDQDLQLCPVGVKGEICISGVAVGIGYWNNEIETNKKFVSNPYKNELGAESHPVIYRTGDTGYWKEDGNLVFLGRVDSMVKIRGVRLEPGEVESALLSIDGIKEAVIVVSEAQLCAYYVSESGKKLDSLRNKLASKIPDYMMPSYFIQIEEMPLTANGKVDRKTLPSLGIDEMRQYVAPSTDIESQLVDTWASILEMDAATIGVTHGFFELGAHSINTFHLVNRIHKVFGANIALKDIFDHDTVQKQAQLIGATSHNQNTGIVRVEDQSFYPVSSAQERMYYYSLIHPTSTAKNVSVPVKINVEPDVNKITSVIQELIDRHESLRTSFVFEDDRLAQRINEGIQFELNIVEAGSKTIADVYDELKQPFDLSDESLLRCSLLRIEEHGNLLFFEVHHIICDGLSLNVLIQEFKELFHGQDLDRPQLRYVDYCCWVKDDAVINKHKSYWSDRLSGEIPILKPTGKSWIDAATHPEAKELIVLEDRLVERVKETNMANQLTDYMLFLSAYYIVLNKMFATNDVIIGTETVGRSQHGLDDIVGTFINVLPLRMNIEESMSRDELFASVKDTVIEAFEYQDFQFDEILLMLSEEGRLPENPLIQFHLTYSNSVNAIEFQEFEYFNIESEEVKDAEYEMIIDITRSEEGLALNFKYSASIYDKEEISLLISNYLKVLEHVCGDQNFKVGDISLDRYEEPIY